MSPWLRFSQLISYLTDNISIKLSLNGILKKQAAITIYYEHPSEDRYITIGISDMAQVLVVVYTLRYDKLRFISARKADKGELKQYFN